MDSENLFRFRYQDYWWGNYHGSFLWMTRNGNEEVIANTKKVI